MSVLFPNVPIAPGVPSVRREAPPDVQTALTADSTPIDPQTYARWGIFDENGLNIAQWDSCATLDYRAEERISDYPIEGGLFESYNKVVTPYEVSVQLTKGGKEADRITFLTALEKAAGSLDSYYVVMPEASYGPVSITRRDFRRTSEQGVQLLVVEVACQQIRVSVTVTFSKSKDASGASTQDDGSVQTGTAPPHVGTPH